MWTTVIELVGALLVAIGCGMAWLPLGLIVGGAMLVGIGYLAAGQPTVGASAAGDQL